MINMVANHLWQSTVFGGAAALLALALRGNRPQVRFWIWMSASLKFLLPLAFLISLGGRFELRSIPQSVKPVTNAVQRLGEPFDASVRAMEGPVFFTPGTASNSVWPSPVTLLIAVWLCGVAVVAARWARNWIAIRRIVLNSHPMDPFETSLANSNPHDLPGVRVLLSASLIEPGVFGVFRPVLLLPEGIWQRLTPSQFSSILAHELCHIRRRDNLLAAIHMAVEAIFWFHPMVWWIGKRMIEERELACDEEVVRLGNEARAYAEGILSVCQFYLESPLACAAGVTGADLRKRVTQIMTRHVSRRMSASRRLLVAAAGLCALAWPLAVGIMNAPASHAQSADLPLKFEVVSVKPNKSGSPRSPSMIMPGGRFTATNNTVRSLILNAYEIPPHLLSGGPSWIDSDTYDIEAKAADGAIPHDLRGRPLWDKTRAMLRALLADRFHLEIRVESKEMPLYEITVAKGGPKLTKSTIDCSESIVACHGFRGNPRRLLGMGVDMSDLASMLAERQGRPVLDKTGISGVFDILLQWNVFYGRERPTPTTDETPRPPSREGPMPDPDSLPDLATALDRQLGLKLESRKGMVDTYVIVRVERPPEN